MKRILALLLALFTLSLPLTACKNKANGATKVAICVPKGSSLDTVYLTESLSKAGYQVAVFEEKIDQNTQLQQIKKLCSEGYGLLIVEPLICSAAKDILAETADTPVLFVNYYGTPPETDRKASFLCIDPMALGRAQGTGLSTLPNGGDLNGDGTICYAVLAGPPDSEEVQTQLDGILESLNTSTLLEIRYCESPSQGGGAVCSGLLATYGRDLEVIICTDSGLSADAVAAITEAGRLPGEDLYVIGAGESPELMELLEKGMLSVTAAPQRDEGGNQVLQTAKLMLEGSPYNKSYSFSYQPLQ